MTTAKTIRDLRTGAHLSQATLAEQLGVDRSAVAQWETGVSQPRMGNVRKLASFFNVPVASILDGIDAVSRSTGPSTVTLRALGKVHAGPFSDEEPAVGEIEVPVSVLSAHPDAGAVLVEGDCMDRVIPEGVAVLYDPDLEPTNGQIVVVETEDHEALIRRWYRGGNTLMLVADSHADYDDIVVGLDKPIRLSGTVVWMQAPRETAT